jgi:hypothetical protein
MRAGWGREALIEGSGVALLAGINLLGRHVTAHQYKYRFLLAVRGSRIPLDTASSSDRVAVRVRQGQ